MTFAKSLKKTVAGLPMIHQSIGIHDDLIAMKNVTGRIMIENFLRENLYEHSKYADPKKLNKYEYQVFSQSGEDGIINEIFKRIGTAGKTFVEFGASNGTENNSLNLLFQRWSGLWIEQHPPHMETIRKNHAEFLSNGKLQLAERFVTAETIESIFREANVPTDPDLLSVDIDGNDYWVWKAIKSFKPRVVCIEYNPHFRPPIKWVMKYDPKFLGKGTTYYGASLASMTELGHQKGYSLVGCNFSGVNAFFVRDDLVKDHFKNPGSAEEHFEPMRWHLHKRFSIFKPAFGPYEAI